MLPKGVSLSAEDRNLALSLMPAELAAELIEDPQRNAE